MFDRLSSASHFLLLSARTVDTTGGREGGTLEGRPVVILTMTGATSGEIRKTPVMRIESDGTYVAVASNGVRLSRLDGLRPDTARRMRAGAAPGVRRLWKNHGR